MDSEHDDAVSQLGGLALGQVLQDMGIVSADSDLSRIGLGSKRSANAQALHRDEIYRNDFDDGKEEEGKDDEEDEEDDLAEDEAAAKAENTRSLRREKVKVRGEDDDFADEEENDQEGSEEQQKQQATHAAPLMSPRTEARHMFPDFQQGTLLDLTELFATRSLKRRKLVGKLPQYDKNHHELSASETGYDEFMASDGVKGESEPHLLPRLSRMWPNRHQTRPDRVVR